MKELERSHIHKEYEFDILVKELEKTCIIIKGKLIKFIKIKSIEKSTLKCATNFRHNLRICCE